MLLPYAHQPLTNHVVKCKVPLHWCQDIGYGVLKQRAGQDNDDGEESYYNPSQNQDLCKEKPSRCSCLQHQEAYFGISCPCCSLR